MTKAQLKTGITEAFRVDPQMPDEKVWAVLKRTVGGVLVALVGLALIAAAVTVYLETHALSLPLLITGVVIFGAGANIASRQLLTHTLGKMLGVFRSAWQVVKGGG